MFRFSKKSLERLETCHKDLQTIAKLAIVSSPIDFGIAEGHRDLATQKKYYDEGKSQIDGITKKGKHNYSPSLAFDYYAWVDGKVSYEMRHLGVIAGVMYAIAEDEGIEIEWGGLWKSFIDGPHIQLK
ncbi:MAG TPA: M15 family metallopeptidase [Candidatus Paceibacterota bacterium]|nr:M15 family metallopeptidase [Candidatus Paceibacterota bacterium]